VRNSKNRAQPELAITLSTQILSDPDSLVLLPVFIQSTFGFHRMLSKRFPFGIYYEVEDEVVYVYAILDLRRDPLWIKERLRGR
jgi:hypothetical protein